MTWKCGEGDTRERCDTPSQDKPEKGVELTLDCKSARRFCLMASSSSMTLCHGAPAAGATLAPRSTSSLTLRGSPRAAAAADTTRVA